MKFMNTLDVPGKLFHHILRQLFDVQILWCSLDRLQIIFSPLYSGVELNSNFIGAEQLTPEYRLPTFETEKCNTTGSKLQLGQSKKIEFRSFRATLDKDKSRSFH